jgi:exosome complex component RRP4
MEDSFEAHLKIVVPGDYIAEGAGLTAGHGTFEQRSEEYQDQSKIYASVAGVVHKIDSWVGVKPLKTGYKPDVGDVVVGRIVSVAKQSWIVDVNSYQHAMLNLTSISLPGGEQRRKSEEDQQNMRQLFKEGDVISAEVQSVGMQDGKINI